MNGEPGRMRKSVTTAKASPLRPLRAEEEEKRVSSRLWNQHLRRWSPREHSPSSKYLQHFLKLQRHRRHHWLPKSRPILFSHLRCLRRYSLSRHQQSPRQPLSIFARRPLPKRPRTIPRRHRPLLFVFPHLRLRPSHLTVHLPPRFYHLNPHHHLPSFHQPPHSERSRQILIPRSFLPPCSPPNHPSRPRRNAKRTNTNANRPIATSTSPTCCESWDSATLRGGPIRAFFFQNLSLFEEVTRRR